MTCVKCELAYNRHHIVFGEGTVPNNLMIIGEAPGYKEDLIGRPFVGKSGELLREKLVKYDLDYGFITNVVKCRPKNNTTLNQSQIDTCKHQFLFKEINVVKPKFIITVGSVALSLFFTGLVTEMSGNVYKLNNVYILPLIHPSYAIRNNCIDKFDSDLAMIRYFTLNL